MMRVYKFLNPCYSCFQTILPFHSTSIVSEVALSNKRNTGKISEEISTFFKARKILDSIPKYALKVYKTPPPYFFVADDDVANEIAELIKNDVSGDKTVIEANPGIGLLTKHFLKNECTQFMVFDAKQPLKPFRQYLSDRKSSIHYVSKDIFRIFTTTIQDKMDGGNRFDEIFKNVAPRHWNDVPVATIVGVPPNHEYLNCILTQVIDQDGLARLGRIVNCLLLTEPLHQRVLPCRTPLSKSYKTFFYELLFDINILATYPRTVVLPWEKGKCSENDKIYLVRIVQKEDIFHHLTTGGLRTLWNFVRGLSRSKFSKVIAFFENWIPGSGLVLIREGFSPMMEVQDVTSSELLTLFNIFTSLPNFDETNFNHIIGNFNSIKEEK